MISREEVNQAQEITDRIFKVLVKSMNYVLENKISEQVVAKGNRSRATAGWPNPNYKNLKEAFWSVDLWSYYKEYGEKLIADEDGDYEQCELIDQYWDEILSVMNIAKAAIIDKYESEIPSVVPLVQMILDTMTIDIDDELDLTDRSYNLRITLFLHAQLLNYTH